MVLGGSRNGVEAGVDLANGNYEEAGFKTADTIINGALVTFGGPLGAVVAFGLDAVGGTKAIARAGAMAMCMAGG